MVPNSAFYVRLGPAGEGFIYIIFMLRVENFLGDGNLYLSAVHLITLDVMKLLEFVCK